MMASWMYLLAEKHRVINQLLHRNKRGQEGNMHLKGCRSVGSCFFLGAFGHSLCIAAYIRLHKPTDQGVVATTWLRLCVLCALISSGVIVKGHMSGTCSSPCDKSAQVLHCFL